MFPSLSVTLIGLLIGVGVMLVAKGDWTTVLVAVVGSWLGFGVGVVAGLALDVSLASGLWEALVGHVLAVVGASIAVRLRVAPAGSSGS